MLDMKSFIGLACGKPAGRAISSAGHWRVPWNCAVSSVALGWL